MPAGARPSPPPPAGYPALVTIPPGTWWRVHPANFGASEFNGSGRGNARFSPLLAPSGSVISTLYAASSLDGALMETIFHDVPLLSRGHIHDLERDLQGPNRASTLEIEQPLQVVDFSSIGLRNIGLETSDLFESEMDDYPRTRNWAHWLRAALPTAQGIHWVARRDNLSQALVLFGDRVDPRAMKDGEHVGLPLRTPRILGAMLGLMARLGVADAGP